MIICAVTHGCKVLVSDVYLLSLAHPSGNLKELNEAVLSPQKQTAPQGSGEKHGKMPETRSSRIFWGWVLVQAQKPNMVLHRWPIELFLNLFFNGDIGLKFSPPTSSHPPPWKRFCCPSSFGKTWSFSSRELFHLTIKGSFKPQQKENHALGLLTWIAYAPTKNGLWILWEEMSFFHFTMS